MTLKDKLKQYKRILRFYLVKAIINRIEALPVTAMPKLARLLLKIFPLVWKKELKRAEELLPEEFSAKKDYILKKMVQNQVLCVLEVLFYDKLIAADPNFVTIEGEAYLEEAKKSGKGIIILTCHYCNWEILGYTLVKIANSLTVLARAQAVNQMTDLINSYRERHGVKVLMTDTIPDAIAVLKRGETMGILVDLDAKEHGYQVKFFGKDASFYSTPVVLSVRSGAMVIPTYVTRTNEGKLVMHFEAPIKWEKNETMKERIQKYASKYEEIFRKRPEFWCWFHERYKYAYLGKKK